FKLDFAELEERHNIMFVTYEEGKITIDEYLDHVVFYKHRDFNNYEFKEYMFSLSTPDPAMIDFISKLKKEHQLKIIAVSNEARELNAYRIHKFNLGEIFDFFISSCYVHIRKPDTAIFKLALDTARVSAEEVVYIDDVKIFTDIDLGIKSIHHTDWQSTSEALADMGMLVGNNKLAHA
ncbi:MAG: HAD-IA family hydrolase, partial [Bacteroidota bacterium]|nr:HAD-IA family hydrolase [Bacteroidota bacterium]